MPLLPNGKVDRQALPAPADNENWVGERFIPPENQLEAEIARLWSELLMLEELSVEADFFALGGHSLLAMWFAQRLQAEWGWQISLLQFFSTPSVRGLAQILMDQGIDPHNLRPFAQPQNRIQPRARHRPSQTDGE